MKKQSIIPYIPSQDFLQGYKRAWSAIDHVLVPFHLSLMNVTAHIRELQMCAIALKARADRKPLVIYLERQKIYRNLAADFADLDRFTPPPIKLTPAYGELVEMTIAYLKALKQFLATADGQGIIDVASNCGDVSKILEEITATVEGKGRHTGFRHTYIQLAKRMIDAFTWHDPHITDPKIGIAMRLMLKAWEKDSLLTDDQQKIYRLLRGKNTEALGKQVNKWRNG